MNKLDFTCTFEDRQLDRVLFDHIHESITQNECNSLYWTYYPTAKECNKVISWCVDRLVDLSCDKSLSVDIVKEKERLCRNVLISFTNIQSSLLSS